MTTWKNKSPGDLSVELPEVAATEVEPKIAAAKSAAIAWAKMNLDDRAAHLKQAESRLDAIKTDLAKGIALETGKPIKECLGELGAVIAKFDFTIADAQRYLKDESPGDAPHPSIVRRRARGPAVVIGPFNFPIHLPHGQILSYLVAGNPVIFKPSPVAANVCARYADAMRQSFPPGVFDLVQGGADEAQALCRDERIRAIGFTGSVPAGKAIAAATAHDLGKDVALELGGKCAAIICADADIAKSAEMCAEAACLTAGQRCNATSRIIVERAALSTFIEKFVAAIHAFVPGDPLLETTRLGPLVNAAAYERYQRLIELKQGNWLKLGHVPASVGGKVGYYVEPAVVLFDRADSARGATLACEEAFAPIVAIIAVDSQRELIDLHNNTPFGLTASVFTKSRARFNALADELEAGNIYANLPTTFSPSQLPFGGWKNSGNGRPGGRGFVRFATEEQAVQMGKDSLVD